MNPESLYTALSNRSGFQVVTHKMEPRQLRVVGRVPSLGTGTWLKIIQSLLVHSGSSPWNVDVSKQYFMRGQKLMYGWRLIFQGDNLEQHLAEITQVVTSTPMVKRQVMEVQLSAGPNRNALRNGRGAQNAIGAIVGPLAVGRT